MNDADLILVLQGMRKQRIHQFILLALEQNSFAFRYVHKCEEDAQYHEFVDR